jgi:hypothetical protein
LVLLLPSPAEAQPSNPPSDAELATARNLFAEARKLQQEGRWADALPKLEAIGQVRMTPQIRFHIALCHLHTGKLVAARNGFETALREARAENADQVVHEASVHIQALKARIPTVRIGLPEQPANLVVRIDDAPIHAGLLAAPVPLDPGSHVVRVLAPGFVPFEAKLDLEEQTSLELSVMLEPLPPSSSAPATPPPASDTLRDASAPDPTLGWVLVGVGGAMLAGSAVTAFVRASAISDIDDTCPSHRDCDPSLESTRDRAQTFGMLSLALAGFGIASAGTGGYLLWSSRGAHADDVALSIHPVAQPGSLGVSGAVQW